MTYKLRGKLLSQISNEIFKEHKKVSVNERILPERNNE